MKPFFNSCLCLSILFLISCSPKKKEANTSSSSDQTIEEVKDLTEYGIANYDGNILGGLKVGDKAPDFELEDEKGNTVTLKKSLESGPVLLVFYRADWCPYCTKHLAKFQDKIIELGDSGNVNVIAISPQTQEYSKKLTEENGYTFPILFDIDHVAMKDYKVFFRVTDEYNEKIFNYKGDYIQTRNDDTNPYMPVPATYMIGQDQLIKFVHYDVNYRERGDVDEAMKTIM